jgi:hypothetical protein
MKKLEKVQFKDIELYHCFAFEDIYDRNIFQVLWQKTGITEGKEMSTYPERDFFIDVERWVWPIDINNNPGRIEDFPGVIILA